jgi:hypothetical protein
MTIVLPALAVAFAAFCVWLGVRIVNRRERWAKWTLAAVVGLPALYVVSFGPACWVMSRVTDGRLPIGYFPIGLAGAYGPEFTRQAICSYAYLGMPDGSSVFCPVYPSGEGTNIYPVR